MGSDTENSDLNGATSGSSDYAVNVDDMPPYIDPEWTRPPHNELEGTDTGAGISNSAIAFCTEPHPEGIVCAEDTSGSSSRGVALGAMTCEPL